jgi:hypothetical protein
MEDLKAKVPAFQGLPSDTGGLTEVVLGNGPKLLSQDFDAAMKQVVENAGNKVIRLPIKDLRALNVPTVGPLPSVAGPRDVMLGAAKAADVAEAVTGMGTKDWRLYARVVQALDKQGIGDPAARAAYKTGIGAIDFLGKSKALEILPEGSVLHTDKIVSALSDPRLVNILRKRDLGTAVEGMMQPARVGTPTAPDLMPSPLNPKTAEVPTGSVDAMTLPGGRLGRGTAGALLGSALGGMTGTGFGHYGPMGAAGGAIGLATPNAWITKAPGTAPLETLLGELAQLGGTGAREAILPEGGTVGRVTPEDLAEIRAAQAAGQTATDNPALQLSLDPSETR